MLLLDTLITTADKTVIEKICEGKTMAETARELGMAQHEVQKRVRRLTEIALLPKEYRTWIAVKDQVYANLQTIDSMNQKLGLVYDSHMEEMNHFGF